MGNFLRKHEEDSDEMTKRISELTMYIDSASMYDAVVGQLFEDKITNGRVRVFYIVSCQVRDHLPVHQHRLIDHFFWKWMTLLGEKLPHEKESLHDMKVSWWKSGWRSGIVKRV